MVNAARWDSTATCAGLVEAVELVTTATESDRMRVRKSIGEHACAPSNFCPPDYSLLLIKLDMVGMNKADINKITLI